jgi:RHH-type proline utilization regulon transcriptional repressor/proline dehydrogenase/delta 1-pyrroline-5-carboxylate dehydrogenase
LLDSVVPLLPEQKDELKATAGSYAKWWNEEFSVEHDPSNLHGESNHFRYRPYPRILLRATGMSDLELAQVALAVTTCGVKMDISTDKTTRFMKELTFPLTVETEKELIDRLPKCAKQYGILRVLSPSEALQRAANDAALQTITAPPLANGRLELLQYLREQAVSETTHRYGNVIPKAKDVLLESK